MFAGKVEEKATLENITINGQMRLWSMNITPKADFHFNLIGNKDVIDGNGTVSVRGVTDADGVTSGNIKLIVCGSLYSENTYYFSDIEPNNVKVDAEGNISLGNPPDRFSREKSQQYHTVYGGDES